jgi:hypothetical protein
VNANYFERKEVLRLRKENAELKATVARLVGERLTYTDPTPETITHYKKLTVLEGSAVLELDNTTYHVCGGETLNMSFPVRWFK